MAPGGMLLFNVDDGYLEGILRGYRSVRDIPMHTFISTNQRYRLLTNLKFFLR